MGLVLPDLLICRRELGIQIFFKCENSRFINEVNEFKFEILCGLTGISVGHMQEKGHEGAAVDGCVRTAS